jgi:branched-chain amino acid transport system permease protein
VSGRIKNFALFGVLALMFAVVGEVQSWNLALQIFNMGLISAIMALGLNIQWGYAGLFNAGLSGFAALGGLAVVLVAAPLDPGAWQAGGFRIALALGVGAVALFAAVRLWRSMGKGASRSVALVTLIVISFVVYRLIFDGGARAVEAINPSVSGSLGGLGLPVLLAWPVGGLLAAAAAWLVGKTALGLRSDYLAIATLGIAEIILSVMRNEDWLARGVKNVIGLPRPVPYEVDLQQMPAFVEFAERWGADPQAASSILVKLCYSALFLIVLLALLFLSERAKHSPWGRMMRAIRDNEVAAEAMGKDIKRRHLHVFVLGTAVIGIAGAMMTTLDGQLTPNSFQPLRFTFLIWVMVIVGGSGNNWGSVLGALLIWFLWVEVEPVGVWLMHVLAAPLPDGALKSHLIDSAEQMRYLTMGIVLLLVLRFSPRGLIPEQ